MLVQKKIISKLGIATKIVQHITNINSTSVLFTFKTIVMKTVSFIALFVQIVILLLLYKIVDLLGYVVENLEIIGHAVLDFPLGN